MFNSRITVAGTALDLHQNSLLYLSRTEKYHQIGAKLQNNSKFADYATE